MGKSQKCGKHDKRKARTSVQDFVYSLKVFPIPSLTAVTIFSNGIPAIRPIAIAPIKIATMACTLNLIIKTNKITRPIKAAITSLVGFKAVVDSINILLVFLSFYLCTLAPAPPMIASTSFLFAMVVSPGVVIASAP